jgi:nucleotide-binding universal stress UspA family protein
MKPFTHIIVPTDFSTTSREALPYAYKFALAYGSKITLLHAITMFEYDPYDPKQNFSSLDEIYANLKASADASCIEIIQDAHNQSNELRLEKVTERGISAREVIIDYAKENDADLIIMATHGRSGISNVLLGSVTEKVIQSAPCPVVAVKKPQHADLKKLLFNNILVPTDFSESSRNAMEYALGIAKKFRSRVSVMHAVDIRFNPAYYAAGVESIFELDPDIKPRIQARLEAFLQSFDLSGATVTTHVTDGKSHREIVKTAQIKQHDLIVMSTSGHDEIADYLIGSTTDRVIKRAPCPVLVV